MSALSRVVPRARGRSVEAAWRGAVARVLEIRGPRCWHVACCDEPVDRFSTARCARPRWALGLGFFALACAGDQSAAGRDAFAALARGSALLIVHHPISEDAEGLTHLHARPSELGELADLVAPGALVLSHHMQRAVAHLDAGRAAIASAYDGPIDVADDLRCYVLAP